MLLWTEYNHKICTVKQNYNTQYKRKKDAICK